MFLSPNQMMRAMGWPMTPDDVRAASLPAMWQTWGQMAESCKLSANGVRAAAGDALNFHTAVVICAVIALFTE